MNLARHLLRTARVYPDGTALARGDTPCATWRELARRAAGLAAGLRERLNLAPGDRVALIMKNCPTYVEALYGCWIAGLAAVPVNAKLHPKEIAYILDHSGARVVLATDNLLDAIANAQREAGTAARIIDVAGAEYRALAAAEPQDVADTQADDLAWLFYTSGTTGRPKGAMLTHRNVLAATLSYFVDVDTIAAGDSIVHAAPMSHGSGLYIMAHVAMGATQVIPESGQFDPAEIFALWRHWRGVTMFAAPTMVKRLVDHPDSGTADSANLKTIVYGGGPMYVADLKAALARFGQKFVQIYGQGESPMTITALSRARHAETDHPRYDARLGSVGVAQSVVEVRIADAGDRTLPAGEPGEILVRGDSVMKGYWRDEEASTRTLRGGWLHTGDVGTFDEDGFLTLKDRSKDLIISGGSNIYPREVEEVLLRHPAVAEASVVGAADPEWGESVVAFVVLRDGHTAAADELDRLCLDCIARFKRPKSYRFVASLPKNNYGKVLKTELRAWLKMNA
ncbi:MAG: AMP-binding protein [Proteobacteria bacterium]|nr:AMP-binding protein [Pseudomonadota bacterium]